MAADLHHVFDQSLDCLLFAEFSLKTLTKSIDDRLGKRLLCAAPAPAPGDRQLSP
jgi:hypothetical protein